MTFAETVDCLVHAELMRSPGDGAPDLSSDPSAPFDLHRARLYVLPVADDSCGGNVATDGIVLLDSDENPYRLLRRTRHHPPIIAGCLVATGWCAPFGLDDEANASAPSSHPMRQRVRLAVAITEHGIASVMRQSDSPDVVHSLPSRGIGDLPDVLDVWWRGI